MRKSSKPACSIADCSRPTKAHGYCALHHKRWWVHGDPLKVLDPHKVRQYVRRPEADRFWEKVDKSRNCWLWTGAIANTGYGSFRTRLDVNKTKAVGAHRWAYENTVGPIPDGLHLDHLCRIRNCVNPAHLEPVTNAENARRGAVARAHDRERRSA